MHGIAWPILDTLQKRNLMLSRLGLYVYTYIHIDMCIYVYIHTPMYVHVYIYSRYIALHHITSHCITLHHITLHHITYMSKEQKIFVINYPSSWLFLDYIPSICLLTQEFNKNLPNKHVFMGQDPNWPRHSCTDQFSGLTSKRSWSLLISSFIYFPVHIFPLYQDLSGILVERCLEKLFCSSKWTTPSKQFDL